MALQKQPMELLFGQGIDTKSDPKTLEIGNLSILENGVLKKKNRIDKRHGYNQIGKTIIGGAASPSVDNNATFKDELLLYANQNLYSYSKSTDQLADKGPCVSAIVTTDQIVKNSYSQFQCDSAELNGVAVFAYKNLGAGIQATVTDSATGLAILSDVSIDTSISAEKIRVLAFQNYIHVFYYKNNVIYVRRINTSSPSAFGAAVATVTDVNSSQPNYDVLNYGEARILIATNYQTSDGIKMTFIDVAGTVYTATYPAVVIGTEAGYACVSLILGDLNKIYLVYQTATPELRCVILNAGLTVLRSAYTLNATASLIKNVTGYARNDGTGIDVIYDFVNAADKTKYVVMKVTAPAVGSATGDAVLLSSVAVSSKAFKYGDYHFFGVVHDSPLQPTFFLVRNDGLIVAKQKYGTAGGILTDANLLPIVSKISDTKFRYSFIAKGTLVSLGGGVFTTLGGVCQTEIDFSAAGVFTSAELGNNLLICGGTLQNYDGQSVTEHGFHLFPEGVTATTSATGGFITVGDYNYVVVYEWTDNIGQLHRSAPSVPLALPISAAGPTSSNTVVIPTLRLTAKKLPTRTPVSLAVYRTAAGGTLYYRASSLITPTLNDPTQDTVNFVDTVPDTTLTSRELLYTTGGVLENFSPGSCSSITTFKNRVFLAGLENKNQVIYSKAVTSGVPVQFAQEFTLLTDEKGPRITALSKLDDKVIIFKKNSFNITYGDGPDDTGVNGSFAQPEFVSSDVGCLDSQSIAQIQGAITFKSDKGLYLLNSQLQTQYFGAPVEDYNSLTVTSAVVKPEVNQIRFTTSTGVCLVFDYFFQQWSTFTNHAGKDAVVWNGSYVYVKSTGEILIESEGFYKDIAAPYHLKVATSWIALAGVNGFQRVYRFGLLGEYKTPHLLSIKAGYDFSSALETVMIFDPVTAMGIDTFGDGGAFGSDSPFGGANISYRVRGHLPRQKCQSIKFVLEELTTAASEGTGEALTVSGLTLIVGVKSGLTKLKSSQSLG